MRRCAQLAAGEMVWASILDGIDNPLALPEATPVIFIQPSGSVWKTIGLTTRPRHHRGTPRVAIPYARAVGVKHPAWLRTGKLCFISRLDTQDHIGWVDQALAFEVAKLAGLDGPTINELLV